MAQFTNEERRDMLQVYYSGNRNARAATQSYFEKYPERPQPNAPYFLKLHRMLGEFGNIDSQRTKYGSRLPLETRDAIIHEINRTPATSKREIAKNLNISKTTV